MLVDRVQVEKIIVGESWLEHIALSGAKRGEILDSDGCVGESKESIAREDDISDTTLEAASSIMEMDEPVDCFHPAMEPEFLPTIYQPVLPSQKDKPSTTFRFIGR
ncbi:hypothetical protein TNIN_353251 [Trichonephila inaurata madagascariensis]|uniref:Uncharacterized protein n=1 Tax=Trichonephila inaurata madagascariensis TaxID=2747483 RepID=A0A8X7BWY1_9ARAC|nr:hypothetical protein TNIN_353251 [Trichonephila inaurata madagascariensis]